MAQHGDTVAGKRIELIIRDDGSIPDAGKRLAQELLVNDKVDLLGAGLSPTALSMAPDAPVLREDLAGIEGLVPPAESDDEGE